MPITMPLSVPWEDVLPACTAVICIARICARKQLFGTRNTQQTRMPAGGSVIMMQHPPSRKQNGMTPSTLNQASTHRRLHLRLSPTNTSENRNARPEAGRFLGRMLSTPSQES
ncbi:hypothetical protein GFGA_1c0672 [Gluconobacter frateurii NBRC 103465]|nr:hypothetical protein GFGA_1c0672 [Gluconobacter frateurii NBRC 103465]